MVADPCLGMPAACALYRMEDRRAYRPCSNTDAPSKPLAASRADPERKQRKSPRFPKGLLIWLGDLPTL